MSNQRSYQSFTDWMDSSCKSSDCLGTMAAGTFSLRQSPWTSGPFVLLGLSGVPCHLHGRLMDADGGSVWHYGHSSACFKAAGHVVCPRRPHSAPLMWPRTLPTSQLHGVSGTVLSGGNWVSLLAPPHTPVNTSQHALIPSSPKVTLLGLQLANRPALPSPTTTTTSTHYPPTLLAELTLSQRRGGAPSWARGGSAQLRAGFPALRGGPSSFTVTSLERNRSKQTCGGREFPTWWIAAISIRWAPASSDWSRPLLDRWSLSDTTHNLGPWSAILGYGWSEKRRQQYKSGGHSARRGKYLQHGSSVFGVGGGPQYQRHSARCLSLMWLPASSSGKRSTGRPWCAAPPPTLLQPDLLVHPNKKLHLSSFSRLGCCTFPARLVWSIGIPHGQISTSHWPPPVPHSVLLSGFL